MGHIQDQLTKNKLNHKITLRSPSAKPPSRLSSLSCDPEAAYAPHGMTCFTKVSHIDTSKKPKRSVCFRLAYCFASVLYQQLTGDAPQDVVTKFWGTCCGHPACVSRVSSVAKLLTAMLDVEAASPLKPLLPSLVVKLFST